MFIGSSQLGRFRTRGTPECDTGLQPVIPSAPPVENRCHPDRSHTGRCRSARGFTLTELVVSIGILAMMMTMVGTVFRVTTDSTGDALAVMSVTRSMALLEQTLRDDLAAVNPGRSMMIIQANRVNAYWTADQAALDTTLGSGDDDPSTGYPHNPDPEREVLDYATKTKFVMDLPRADVLMFFTSRRQRSSMYPGIWSNSAQVVYGHAEIGELDKNGAWTATPTAFPPEVPYNDQFTLTPTPYPVSAEQWHLARRSVLLVDAPEIALDQYSAAWVAANDDIPNGLDDVLDAGGDTLETLLPLQDGLVDLVDGTFIYQDEVADRYKRMFPTSIGAGEWIKRSQLDLLPPPQKASRLGHYFIPRCASFKVEWALDLRGLVPFTAGAQPPPPFDGPPDGVVWLDPGRVDVNGVLKPFEELDVMAAPYGLLKPTINALKTDLLRRFDPTLNDGAIDAQTPVWYASDAVNASLGGKAGDPDRFFPVALRITVDVYDESSRLERPMRHVMVLPVGTQ